MMNRISTILIFFASISVSQMLSLPQAFSQVNDKVLYVSDVLVINVKDRLEAPYNIVTTVQSDDSVQVIEEKANYLKIQTADGKQGWIAKQYLKADPPKNHIIKQLKQEIAELQNKLTQQPGGAYDNSSEKIPAIDAANKELKQKLQDAEKKITELVEERQGRLQTASESAATSLNEMASSPAGETNSGAQSLENSKYAMLISEFEKRGKQINDLQMSIAQKNDQTGFLWFGAGAAVFFLGLLAGKMNNRKKRKLTY